jgi:hypothetical protein
MMRKVMTMMDDAVFIVERSNRHGGCGRLGGACHACRMGTSKYYYGASEMASWWW